MNLVACMLVGNEAELVEASIKNALHHGVDAFVIVETASSDGTTDILRSYADDPRFDITFLTHDAVYGQNFANPADIWKDIIARAKSRFQASWILRMDADEFIMTRSGSLKDICARCTAEGLELERFNVLVPDTDADLSVAAQDHETLSQLQVLACPFPNPTVLVQQYENMPLILTKIVSKVMCRADALHGYTAGGHAAEDAHQTRLETHQTVDAWFVHFWFTTEERFLRKCQFISDISKTVRAKTNGGWQWSRWGSLSEQSVAAAKEEFARQLVDQDRLAILSQQGRTSRADQVFDLAFQPPANVEQDHIAQLGLKD